MRLKLPGTKAVVVQHIDVTFDPEARTQKRRHCVKVEMIDKDHFLVMSAREARQLGAALLFASGHHPGKLMVPRPSLN